MRIIAGKFGGRHLNPPRDSKIRPTTDRIKQMIFDALGYPFRFQRILDLFAGTGNLGLEAMSRGAESVIFVDNSNSATEIISANCQLLALSASAQIVRTDVFKALNHFSTQSSKFDLIFADPPYQKMYAQSILAFFENADLLAENGLLVLEHSSRDFPQPDLSRIQCVKQKNSGETSFSFYSVRCN
jgi:16S rRNA (guanine(966)-N(2))-methyltransferase RsmD